MAEVPGEVMDSLPTRPLKSEEIEALYQKEVASPFTIIPLQNQNTGESKTFATSIFVYSEKTGTVFIIAYSEETGKWHRIYSSDAFEVSEDQMWSEVEPWLSEYSGLPFTKPAMNIEIESIDPDQS